MENQAQNAVLAQGQVKATLCLGSERFTVCSKGDGLLSEQLASVKEESVGILRDFITRHNVPIDVPDDLEGSSGDEDEIVEKPPKSKKRK